MCWKFYLESMTWTYQPPLPRPLERPILGTAASAMALPRPAAALAAGGWAFAFDDEDEAPPEPGSKSPVEASNESITFRRVSSVGLSESAEGPGI